MFRPFLAGTFQSDNQKLQGSKGPRSSGTLVKDASNLARNLGQYMVTHRSLSSSFLGLPYRNLNINHKKELLIVQLIGAYGY